MHNGQLADPLNPHTRAIKEVAGRRKKTDQDHEELSALEWRGGLYLDQKGRVVVPEDVILAMVIEGAKRNKNGPKAKAGVLGAEPFFPLGYDGPKDAVKLGEDPNFRDYRGVGIRGTATVMRTRPRFEAWWLAISLLYDDTIIDRREVVTALETGGHVIGIGDFRPRFGRFTVEVQ